MRGALSGFIEGGLITRSPRGATTCGPRSERVLADQYSLPAIADVLHRLAPHPGQCSQPTDKRASWAVSPFNTLTSYATLVGSVVRLPPPFGRKNAALSLCRHPLHFR